MNWGGKSGSDEERSSYLLPSPFTYSCVDTGRGREGDNEKRPLPLSALCLTLGRGAGARGGPGRRENLIWSFAWVVVRALAVAKLERVSSLLLPRTRLNREKVAL